MIYILTAKSVYNSEHHFEVHRKFPDIGPIRKFCGHNLLIKNLNSDQLKRLLAGDNTKLGRWDTQVLYAKFELPADQECVWVLKAVNDRNNRVDIKAYTKIPTLEECRKFDKGCKLQGVLQNIDDYITLGAKHKLESGTYTISLVELKIL